MKTALFQSCDHCWVFQICWHIECSTFTASFFRIWNSSTGIPSTVYLCVAYYHLNSSTLLQISFLLWLSSIPCQRRQWQPTPVLVPGKSHGQRSLVGCSSWGPWELDMTQWIHFDFSLSCIGEGNGNPLHCSCLENPRDGGAWWAAVYGVAQSRTWLKQKILRRGRKNTKKNYIKKIFMT